MFISAGPCLFICFHYSPVGKIGTITQFCHWPTRRKQRLGGQNLPIQARWPPTPVLNLQGSRSWRSGGAGWNLIWRDQLLAFSVTVNWQNTYWTFWTTEVKKAAFRRKDTLTSFKKKPPNPLCPQLLVSRPSPQRWAQVIRDDHNWCVGDVTVLVLHVLKHTPSGGMCVKSRTACVHAKRSCWTSFKLVALLQCGSFEPDIDKNSRHTLPADLEENLPTKLKTEWIFYI